MDSLPLHPFLADVNEARQQAKIEDYANSIKYYDQALEKIDDEIAACHDIQANQKWNKMQKEVRDEKDSVLKIKRAFDRILNSIDTETTKRQPEADGDNETLEPPQVRHQRRSPEPPKQFKPPQRRRDLPGERRQNQNVQRRASVSPQIGVAGKHVQPRPRVMVDQPIKPGKPRVSVAPPKGEQGQNRPANPQVKKGNQEKSPAKTPDPLDPSTNPLVQQIIDMGILVREPNIQWSSIAGLAGVKRLLRQNLVILPMRPDIAKGLLAPWKSVLFYGPPGTGKTYLAKAVATECKRTFFNITAATITSRFLGESEKLVNYLFALANQMAPATIFFDEVDSIASQRGSGNENEASRRIKAELLTQLEGIDGTSDRQSVFVLAATNFPWDLDEALLRRFQKRIYIPLPDYEGRLEILKMSIQENASEDFDYEGWAKKLDGYSCADVTNLCRDAVQMVFDKFTSMLDTQEFLNMPAENAKMIVGNNDFAVAVAKRRPSVDAASLKKYDEWRLSKGAE